jgi:hypothetical protein
LRGNSKGYQEAYSHSVDSIFQYLAENIKIDNQGTQLSIIGEAYSVPGKTGYIPKINQQSCSAAAMIGLGARLLQKDSPLNFAQNVSLQIYPFWSIITVTDLDDNLHTFSKPMPVCGFMRQVLLDWGRMRLRSSIMRDPVSFPSSNWMAILFRFPLLP